jgi:hypothetical protein
MEQWLWRREQKEAANKVWIAVLSSLDNQTRSAQEWVQPPRLSALIGRLKKELALHDVARLDCLCPSFAHTLS